MDNRHWRISKLQRLNKTWILLILLSLTILTVKIPTFRIVNAAEDTFSEAQVGGFITDYASYSPLIPGTQKHQAFQDYANRTLTNYSWDVRLQTWSHATPNVELTNVVAMKKGTNATDHAPIIVCGAHYDTRAIADKDPDPSQRNEPVPGINDGGSGVAILFELARVLRVPSNYEVWFVLFDAEDQGSIIGWQGGISGWCIGSTFFVENLTVSQSERIVMAIILDIVGSPNLQLTQEGSSNSNITQGIWDTGIALGYNDTFLNIPDISITDDHRPFLSAGIPAVDIIQIHEGSYSFFQWHHTVNDTLENLSTESLFVVGRTLEHYLENLSSHTSLTPGSFADLQASQITIVAVIIVGGLTIVFYYRRSKANRKLSSMKNKSLSARS